MRSEGEQEMDDGVTVMFAVTVNVFDVVEFPAGRGRGGEGREEVAHV